MSIKLKEGLEYNNKIYRAGETITIELSKEEKLVKNGVAEFIQEPSVVNHNDDIDQEK